MRLGCVPGASYFLGAPQRDGILFLKVGEPRVFLPGEDQVGRGGVEPGPRFFDPVLDLVLCQLQ